MKDVSAFVVDRVVTKNALPRKTRMNLIKNDGPSDFNGVS